MCITYDGSRGSIVAIYSIHDRSRRFFFFTLPYLLSTGTVDFSGKGYLNKGESTGEDFYFIFIYSDDYGCLFRSFYLNDKYILVTEGLLDSLLANQILVAMFYC